MIELPRSHACFCDQPSAGCGFPVILRVRLESVKALVGCHGLNDPAYKIPHRPDGLRHQRVLVPAARTPLTRLPAQTLVPELTANHAVAARGAKVKPPAFLPGRVLPVVLDGIQEAELAQGRHLLELLLNLFTPAG